MIAPDLIASSAASVAAHRVSDTWTWYVIRASGLTAATLLILLMISGIGQVTGLTYRFIEPLKSWALHKALAIALCVAVVIHGGFLLIDNYIKFSIPDVLVPFMSHYNNGTKLFGLPLGDLGVAFGVLAAYCIAITVASSLSWIDTKKGLWRKLHYLNYLVAILVFLHVAYVGSDVRYGAFRRIWILVGLLLIVGIVSRLFRAKTLTSKD